jgi:hypothetical protein
MQEPSMIPRRRAFPPGHQFPFCQSVVLEHRKEGALELLDLSLVQPVQNACDR